MPPPANDVSLSETRHNVFNAQLPDRAKWPETRRALVLWTQEHLDRELAKLPLPEWFDRALAAHVVGSVKR